MTTITPAAIDTRIGELMIEAQRAAAAVTTTRDAIHRAAGDTMKRIAGPGSAQGWTMSLADAKAAIPTERLLPLLTAETEAIVKRTDLQGQIKALDAIYRAHRWTRYYFCTNTNGHIHSDERACSTLRPTTQMAWHPELSGLTGAEVVAQVGPAMCTVCYPDAPVEHTSSDLTAIERAARRPALDARKAEIAAKKARTQLDPAYSEPFRTSHGHERIETVNACQKVIRDAADQQAEVEFYITRTFAQSGWKDEASFAQFLANIRRSLAEQHADAEVATAILANREARHEGYGMTAEAIEAMRDRKLAASRKAWAKNAA